MSAALEIRQVEDGDQAQWRRLWTGYLKFYAAQIPDDVYETTWQRLLGPEPYDPSGLMAFRGGEAVGLVHYIFHRHCWHTENVCYLNDLFVRSDVRGTGVGRALIEAVYDRADAERCPHVYWMTMQSNQEARQLYDRVGELTPFIEYQRRSKT